MNYEETIENAKLIEDLFKMMDLLKFSNNPTCRKVTITFGCADTTKSVTFNNELIKNHIRNSLQELHKNMTIGLKSQGITDS